MCLTFCMQKIRILTELSPPQRKSHSLNSIFRLTHVLCQEWSCRYFLRHETKNWSHFTLPCCYRAGIPTILFLIWGKPSCFLYETVSCLLCHHRKGDEEPFDEVHVNVGEFFWGIHQKSNELPQKKWQHLKHFCYDMYKLLLNMCLYFQILYTYTFNQANNDKSQGKAYETSDIMKIAVNWE